MKITILHVEDDPILAKLVRVAFKSFGFHGTMLAAERVEKALALLEERARHRQPIDLILSDMQLPDGTGLDVVQAVRADLFWRLTPVLVLSNVMAPDVINEAYALGANCYLPKSTEMMQSLRSVFDCWVNTALLPQPPAGDRVQQALSRAINLRARTSEVFLRLADLFVGDPEEMRFWLERSLSEGNLANLLALFRRKLSEQDLPSAAIDRLTQMQGRVEETLRRAEMILQTTASPDSGQVYRMALSLAEVVDEEVFAESLGFLFPKSPAATMALRERAATHFNALANHVLERTVEPEIRQRAEAVRKRAGRIAAAREAR